MIFCVNYQRIPFERALARRHKLTRSQKNVGQEFIRAFDEIGWVFFSRCEHFPHVPFVRTVDRAWRATEQSIKETPSNGRPHTGSHRHTPHLAYFFYTCTKGIALCRCVFFPFLSSRNSSHPPSINYHRLPTMAFLVRCFVVLMCCLPAVLNSVASPLIDFVNMLHPLMAVLNTTICSIINCTNLFLKLGKIIICNLYMFSTN